jgi:hypothetical protein
MLITAFLLIPKRLLFSSQGQDFWQLSNFQNGDILAITDTLPSDARAG